MAAGVANSFVNQYYMVLNHSPDLLNKFYMDSSQLGWPDSNDVVTPVTTISEIKEKINSSVFKNCVAEVNTLDAQSSESGGVFVNVSGFFYRKDKEKNIFFQSFFLAKQAKGFYILNDALRVFAVCGSTADDALSDASDSVAPETSASAVEPSASASVPPAVAPAASGSAPTVVKPVVARASNVAPIITYASLVAKTTSAMSPKAAPLATKAAPLHVANGAPKASFPALSNAEQKATGVFLGKLPWKVTKHMICEALKKFGRVRRDCDSVQIRSQEDGFCCAFVEFSSPDSARRAVEARKVKFGENESFIVYKKSSSYNRGSRLQTNGGYQNGNGNGNQSNLAKICEWSRSSSQGAR